MITLLDPPENDDVLYNVLYAPPPPNPLHTMVAASAEHASPIDPSSEVLQSTRLPSSSNLHLHHFQSEEVSLTDDETTATDDEDFDMQFSSHHYDDDAATIDSLRKELAAIEDSWGKYGLEHLVHLQQHEQMPDDYRVDGIPTFTMPVNMDMSWDESDFLEEMADDAKLLDAVAGKVLHDHHHHTVSDSDGFTGHCKDIVEDEIMMVTE
ncbi:hypothetical protein MPSEU_000616600 [Mayamaea pseudoterrestris]|nr:hypothetical protein MPSEU_000616600 [Mayamaea pseudoterrestris]